MGYAVAKLLRSGIETCIRRLDARAVFPVDEFPWSKVVEGYHPAIQKELTQLLPRLNDITNFDSVLPGLIHGEDWKSFYLIGACEAVTEHQLLCPETSKALGEIPQVLNAFFSIFQPGMHTRPHKGPYAGVIRYHLGVIIPEGDVGIKVAGQIHRWQEGKSLIFDDRFEHEAWNHTNSVRGILFVDIERPLPFPLSLMNKLLLQVFKHSSTAKDGKEAVFNNQLG